MLPKFMLSPVTLSLIAALCLCVFPTNGSTAIGDLEKDAHHQSDQSDQSDRSNQSSQSDESDPAKRINALKQAGDRYYEKRRYKDALKDYQAAIELSQASAQPDSSLPALLESAMGCLRYMKRLAEAEVYGKMLLQEAIAQAKCGRVDNLNRLLWAYLQLRDLYMQMGRDTERSNLRPALIALVDQILAQDDNSKMKTVPLIVWRPPTNEQPRAVILCIHGLGLNNQAFEMLGEFMAKRDFVVYALDVRGFGSWMSVPGNEDVRFDSALSDIGSVIDYIKERNSNLPIFVLGESMGGAIGLRAAAMYGKEISGVVSSVPSPQRHKSGRMGAKVAFEFIKGADRPFCLADMVASRATSRADLQEYWKEDPKSKLEMTPMELTKFARFMDLTKRQCKKIDSTPVFVIQGLKDRLVKPKGTYELFKAVNSEDKTMFVVGDAEHLIFETDTPSTMILDSVNTWLNDHLAAQN